jgi:hypothetical protein
VWSAVAVVLIQSTTQAPAPPPASIQYGTNACDAMRCDANERHNCSMICGYCTYSMSIVILRNAKSTFSAKVLSLDQAASYDVAS